MSTQLIDTVAAPERARLHALRAQQETVRNTIRDLAAVSKNDDFFSVASAELAEAANADRVLDGELKIIEAEIVARIVEARREADAALRAELRPLYKDMLKTLAAARDVRRKILAKVNAHVDQTGSMVFDGVPFSMLEVVDDAAATLRAEGTL